MFYQQFEINTTAIITLYEPYDEQSSYYTGTFRSLPNGIRDEINLTTGTLVQNIAHDSDISGTDYDSLDTTTYTNVDVVVTTAFSLAKAGTTAADGMTRYYNKNGVELSEVAQADIDNTASVGKYYWGSDKKLYIIVSKGAYADIIAARTGLGTTKLTYQLKYPITSKKHLYVDFGITNKIYAKKNDTIMWLPQGNPEDSTTPTIVIDYRAL